MAAGGRRSRQPPQAAGPRPGAGAGRRAGAGGGGVPARARQHRPGAGARRGRPERHRARASGPCASRRWPCFPGSATRGRTRSGVPFDPLRHEVVAVVAPEEAGQPAGSGGRRAAARLRRPGTAAATRGGHRGRPAGELAVARDYYDVLGVGRERRPGRAPAAYRRLARANHPDVNRDPAAEERFKEVNEAYHVLSDPQTRRRYDRFGDDFRRVPEDWEDRVSRSGVRGGGPGVPGGRVLRLPGRRVRRLRDAGPTSAAAGPGSTSRTCWAGSSAGAGRGRWTAPTRRPSSR